MRDSSYLRKRIAALAACLVALVALPQRAQAQTAYNLWIGGVQVTSANCANLRVLPAVKSGTAAYNPATRTLTLTDAVISQSGLAATIRAGIENLTIRARNTRISAQWTALLVQAATTLTGGDITIEAGFTGILVRQPLTIQACNVTARALGAIRGDRPESRLTIRNATVKAEGFSSSTSSISGLSSLTLEGCAIAAPIGAVWNAQQKAVCDAGGKPITGLVHIAMEDYGLWIGGVRVNSGNCADLSVLPAVQSGSAAYNPATRTLTLTNAVIDGGINAVIENLTIRARNTSITTEEAAFWVQAATTLTGGDITLTSRNASGIRLWNPLTIQDCNVTATGRWGIAGVSGAREEERLTIRNATVKAQGTYGTIRGLRSLTIEGCAIAAPDGAVWNAGKKAVCDTDGNVIWGTVHIVPTVTITVPAASQVASFSHPKAVTVPEGVSVYIATQADDRGITLAKVETRVIPPNTGVILYSETAGDILLHVWGMPEPALFAGNLLRATSATPQTATGQEYAIRKGTRKFARVQSGVQIPARKAYLHLPGSGVKELALLADGLALDIEAPDTGHKDYAPAYTPQGQRVGRGYKGLVIQGGRKHVQR